MAEYVGDPLNSPADDDAEFIAFASEGVSLTKYAAPFSDPLHAPSDQPAVDLSQIEADLLVLKDKQPKQPTGFVPFGKGLPVWPSVSPLKTLQAVYEQELAAKKLMHKMAPPPQTLEEELKDITAYAIKEASYALHRASQFAPGQLAHVIENVLTSQSVAYSPTGPLMVRITLEVIEQ